MKETETNLVMLLENVLTTEDYLGHHVVIIIISIIMCSTSYVPSSVQIAVPVLTKNPLK